VKLVVIVTFFFSVFYGLSLPLTASSFTFLVVKVIKNEPVKEMKRIGFWVC